MIGNLEGRLFNDRDCRLFIIDGSEMISIKLAVKRGKPLNSEYHFLSQQDSGTAKCKKSLNKILDFRVANILVSDQSVCNQVYFNFIVS